MRGGGNDNMMRCSNWMLTYGYTRIVWSWDRLKCLRRPQVVRLSRCQSLHGALGGFCIHIGLLLEYLGS